MEKYTFESWLNNEIDEKTLYSWSWGLNPLRGQIDEVEFRKIRAKQKETYETAVEITFKSMVRKFEHDFEQSPYPKKMYEYTVAWIKSILDNNLKRTKSVLSGYKSYIKITGWQHSKVLESEKNFNLNEINTAHVTINDYQRIMSIIHFQDYLEKFRPLKKLPLKLTAKACALFCNIVNDCGLIKKGEETIPEFCIRICEKFALPYNDNVRQAFSQGSTNEVKDLEKIKKIILPKLNEQDQEKINAYLVNREKKYY